MKTLFSILLCSGLASNCFAGDPTRPPPLTFDKHVDYLRWYDEFVSKGRDPGDNALADYYKLCGDKSGNAGIEPPQGRAAEQLELALRKPWNAADFPELKSYLDQSKAYFEFYEQGTHRPYFWQTREPGSQTLIEVVFPSFSYCRNASKAMIAQGWMLDEHQVDRMLTNWQIILGNAKHFGQAPSIIAGLVHDAQQVLVYQQACGAIKEKVIKGKNIGRAISVLRENNPGASNLKGAITLEWAFALDTLQHVAPKGKLDEKQWAAVRKMTADENESKSNSFNTDDALKKLEEFFPKLTDSIKGSISLKRLQKLKALRQAYSPAIRQNAFLALMLTDYTRAYEMALRTEVQRRGTMLVLALHDSKNKSKKWPAGLDELEIEGLKTLRIDPYSGKDFIYKLTKDGPLLYSIASDGKDDQGRHDPKWGEGDKGGDYVFWPMPVNP